MKLPLLICVIALLLSGCDNDDVTTAGGSDSVQQAATAPGEPMPQDEPMGEAGEPAPAEPVMEQPLTEQPMAEAQPTAAPMMTGEQVFKKHCFACHMTGAANAPKVGDARAWAPRIEKGMDALVMSALEGVPNTAMPAKGTCNSCSEDELKAAIEFMVRQSR